MEKFQAKNPDFEAVVRDSFARQPFMAHVNAEMTALAPGVCELKTVRMTELTQQHGFFHGGLVVSLADSAAGYAAYSLFPPSSTVLTVDLKTNFLNPANGQMLKAVGTVISEGDKLYHVKAEAFSIDNGKEKLCLTGLFTMMCLQGKSDGVAVDGK
ncbi:PaaI family thioesterase [Sneathiella glossodoripedis]|uniref:PaaI family thioesterase n=1 Tax=Sneathiella glossodoripedis TaxID=418853 RepID=UPI0004728288|nr:PaaI family thioesterase [Sneathiella glossodoripedis]